MKNKLLALFLIAFTILFAAVLISYGDKPMTEVPMWAVWVMGK